MAGGPYFHVFLSKKGAFWGPIMRKVTKQGTKYFIQMGQKGYRYKVFIKYPYPYLPI
jgi:hypothetical protein